MTENGEISDKTPEEEQEEEAPVFSAVNGPFTYEKGSLSQIDP